MTEQLFREAQIPELPRSGEPDVLRPDLPLSPRFSDAPEVQRPLSEPVSSVEQAPPQFSGPLDTQQHLMMTKQVFDKAFGWKSDTSVELFRRVSGMGGEISEDLGRQLSELYLFSFSTALQTHLDDETQERRRAESKFIFDQFTLSRKGAPPLLPDEIQASLAVLYPDSERYQKPGYVMERLLTIMEDLSRQAR